MPAIPLPFTASLCGRTVQILLVDSNPADAELFGLALAECPGAHRLQVAATGEEALAYLSQRPDEHLPRPDLIVLELNLTGMDGLEVLAALKNNPAVLMIPVVVWSNCPGPAEFIAAYRLQAACCFRKPIEWEEYAAQVGGLLRFWMHAATLPPRPSSTSATHG